MKSQLHIGFDAKRAFNNSTGLGVYSRRLISDLHSSYPMHTYSLFTTKSSSLCELKPGMKLITPTTRNFMFWRQWGIVNEPSFQTLDIYHGLSNEIPFRLRKGVRYVCTVHDLIWLKFPQLYSLFDRFIYTAKLKNVCQKAHMIVATSQQTADDLIQIMKVPPHKIRVVYQSGPPIVSSQNNTRPIHNPYFFYLSSFEHRKNHRTVIEAFAALTRKENIKLVFAGKKAESIVELKQLTKTLKVEEHVVFLSDISEKEKQRWMHHALAFLYPSFYEGFGIPLLEAMQQGARLLLSDLPVFREIAGNCARYLSPFKKEEWTIAMQEIIDNPHSLPFYSPFDVLERFSTQQTASSLMSVYGEVMEMP